MSDNREREAHTRILYMELQAHREREAGEYRQWVAYQRMELVADLRDEPVPTTSPT